MTDSAVRNFFRTLAREITQLEMTTPGRHVAVQMELLRRVVVRLTNAGVRVVVIGRGALQLTAACLTASPSDS